jgi:hypothetical protein
MGAAYVAASMPSFAHGLEQPSGADPTVGGIGGGGGVGGVSVGGGGGGSRLGGSSRLGGVDGQVQDQERNRPGAYLSEVKPLEEVIAFIVDDNEGGEVFDLNAPNRLHAEFGVFHNVDFLDAILGQVGGCPSD